MTKKQERYQDLLSDFRKYLVDLQEDGVNFLPAEEINLKVSAAPSTVASALADDEGGDSLLSVLRYLKEKGSEIKGCQKCPLARGRKKVVFGEGGFKKRVMFIGEGPGETEDLQGRPFVGRAGKLLDKILLSVGLTREDVYITNIVKCRPPGNRDPAAEEVIACWPYLEEQIQQLRPRVIVALGAPASRTLLESNRGISELRGKIHDFQGIPLLATYHPAYLLRAYTIENRRRVWSDVQKLRDFLNHTI